VQAMRDVWGQSLADLASHDDRILVLDGDLANSTKADRFASTHPARFLQMGIAEQNLVGAAVGLATLGFVPWLSSFAVFFTHRALDPVRMLVAQTGANVKIAGAYAGLLTGLTGRTHQDVADLAIMRSMPGMVVLSPADAAECMQMVDWASAYDGPVYLRLARDGAPDLPMPDDRPFQLGAVRVLRHGAHATLVSTGVQTTRVLEAADILHAEGVDVRVVHLPTVKPVDRHQLISATRDTPLVVSVEEHSVIGGLGGLLAETLAAAPSAPLHRIGLDDLWTESAPNDFLLDKYGLSAVRVAARARQLVTSEGIV